MWLQYSLSSGWRLNVTFLVFVWLDESRPCKVAWWCGFLFRRWLCDIIYIFASVRPLFYLDCISRSCFLLIRCFLPRCEHVRVQTTNCSTTKLVTWDHVCERKLQSRLAGSRDGSIPLGIPVAWSNADPCQRIVTALEVLVLTNEQWWSTLVTEGFNWTNVAM